MRITASCEEILYAVTETSEQGTMRVQHQDIDLHETRTRPGLDDGRGDLVRVLRLQVQSGRYQVQPEYVAEQLLAWSRNH